MSACLQRGAYHSSETYPRAWPKALRLNACTPAKFPVFFRIMGIAWDATLLLLLASSSAPAAVVRMTEMVRGNTPSIEEGLMVHRLDQAAMAKFNHLLRHTEI